MRQLVGGDVCAPVLHLYTGVPALPQGVQPDLRVGRGVFDGVVQQDGHRLSQLLPVAPHRQVRRDVVGQGMACLEGHRFEPQGGVRRDVGKVRRRVRQVRAAALHPGQGQHILHQPLHAVGLGADVIHILLLLRQRGLVQQLRRGQHHRQGRFQLMAGIGQELLLLLPRTGHRPRHRTAEHIAAGEQHRQRHKSDEQAAGQQAAEGSLLQRAVGKGDAGGQKPHAPQIAQVVVRQHALVLLSRQGGGDDVRQR